MMDWLLEALCRDYDPEIWFPRSDSEERRARALCGLCPVKPECLDMAISNREMYGIWGGLDKYERQTVARFRRKNDGYSSEDRNVV